MVKRGCGVDGKGNAKVLEEVEVERIPAGEGEGGMCVGGAGNDSMMNGTSIARERRGSGSILERAFVVVEDDVERDMEEREQIGRAHV